MSILEWFYEETIQFWTNASLQLFLGVVVVSIVATIAFVESYVQTRGLAAMVGLNVGIILTKIGRVINP